MKRTIDDLAVFGGPAAFLNTVTVGRPSMGDRERFESRMAWVLNNEWLTNSGPLVSEFETAVAEIAGVRHCVATSNATVGLQLAMHAAGVRGEVIMPAMTFAATPHAASWIGLEPVFCDVDPVTGLIDPDDVKRRITERTGAVVGVHLWGQVAPVEELDRLAHDHGLVMLYDAAHALGCTRDDRPAGSFGDAEVFSFHATKVVTSFEGGALVTDDATLAARARSMHNFGLGQGGRVEHVGTNAKMSEASAAMGLTSLDAFAEVCEHNRRNHELYAEELRGVKGLRLHELDLEERSNYQYVIVSVDPAHTGIDRDEIIRVLAAEQVVAKPYFSPPCHLMEPYRTETPQRIESAEWLAAQVVALPTGPGVSAEDIRRICDVLRLVVADGEHVARRLTAARNAPS
ncbi:MULTISPECIES: dTDP-4-dehydro-6-deoxyglucose aminotransferase [unclassified Aeromicrobium]|uniref:dTDP-4-dehydro-6-deoxyglucose aminotransferase n=1 Tax=unclassified Aeromicrobium TaxID=2633570 RepID=UPI000AA77F5D|nr:MULTISPECIES: dTDP-4-dehydro-6-deoxyglucose aminotransferase [unclassified Aeromicrobium]